MKKILLVSALLFACFGKAAAQTTKEEMTADLNKTGGVYYAYPVRESANTPAPKGFKPFYISHYGRHGSRYLISDEDYTRVASLLAEASASGALTPLGEELRSRLDSLMKETAGRGGDLTPLGVRQHRDIARRMFEAYPEVFKGKVAISARSTLVPRCILSMDAFCESLKEQNPALDITRESTNRYMNYLCYHSPESNSYTSKEWKEQYRKFEEKHTHPDRLVASIFSDGDFVDKKVNPHDFAWSLYWIASGMQDVETKLSFYDFFTPDELFDLWRCFNYRFYACDGNYPGNRGLPVANAANLLRNIIDSADAAIASGKTSATLRFGHDGNLIPLAAILQLEDCALQEEDPEKFHTAFSDFKIAPMAGNVQLIFFRNDKTGEVLVKLMLNEREKRIPVATDRFPFYRWDDVKNLYERVYKENAAKITLTPLLP